MDGRGHGKCAMKMAKISAMGAAVHTCVLADYSKGGARCTYANSQG